MSYHSSMGDTLVARQGYAGLDGLSWGDVQSFGKDLLGKARNLYDATQQQKGAQAAYQQMAQQAPKAATPAWVVPAAIGGTALVAFLLLRRR